MGVMLYVSGVVFAVISIIQALFLKDTLDAAANDAAAMVQASMMRRNETICKLAQVFLAADVDGDGVLSMQEFEDVISIPEVNGFLELLEINIGEVRTLFNILDTGDGCIDYEEFVGGIMRVK